MLSRGGTFPRTRRFLFLLAVAIAAAEAVGLIGPLTDVAR